MANDPVTDAVAATHKVLDNASNFGQRETGNKKAGTPTPPHKASSAPITYSAAHKSDSEPSVTDELKSKADNVNQYAASQK